MNFIPFLLIFCLYRVNCADLNATSDVLKAFLESQAEMVKLKLDKIPIQETIDKKENHYDFGPDEEVTLNKFASQFHTFMLLQDIYAIIGKRLYVTVPTQMKFVTEFDTEDEIVLVKTIQHPESLGFILLVEKTGIVHLYALRRDKDDDNARDIIFIQMLDHPNFSDASFFVHENRVHLIISNYGENSVLPTVIYKFTGAHFDEVTTVSLSGAKKLFTFPGEDEEEIILVFQYSPREKRASSVYKFQKEQMTKLQKFRVSFPETITSFTFREQNFLVLFGKESKISRYVWTGSEIRYVDTAELTLEHPMFVYLYDTPVLAASQNNTIMIYVLEDDFQFSLYYQFSMDLKRILGMRPRNNGSQIILWGLQSALGGQVKIVTAHVTVRLPESDGPEKAEETNEITSCLLQLEKRIYGIRKKIAKSEKRAEVIVGRSSLKDNSSLIEIQDNVVKLESNIKKYESLINLPQSDILEIHDTAILKGSLQASKVTAQDIYVKQINNEQWSPNEWMSYSKPQTVRGTVKVRRMKVADLQTGSNALFDNLLLNRGTQTLTGRLSVTNMRTNNLESDSYNNIPFDNIYLKSNPVLVSGLKLFTSLNVEDSQIGTVNGMKANDLVVLLTNFTLAKYTFSPLLKIENLWVDKINDIDWDRFANSVYRIGKSDSIKGNLEFHTLRAKNMHINTINKKINASEILTISTNQTVKSSIAIGGIFTETVESELINGIDFGKSVATFDSHIKGPVNIEHVSVKDNFEMKGVVDQSLLLKQGQHIVGTNESDLLQMYNGKVKIEGNLILNNLNLDGKTQLIISNNSFDPAMKSYWTKSTKQVIPNHFEALNGMSTPHLFTISLNDIAMTDYMHNSREPKKPTKYYFQNVTVYGNVILNHDFKHAPDLRRLNEKMVKTEGRYFIRGNKTYTNLLKVDYLATNTLDNVTVANLMNQNKSVNIKDFSSIKKIIVRGNLKSNVSTDMVNDVNITKLQEDALYVDRNEDFDSVNFKSLSVKNLHLNKLNNNHVNSEIMKLEKLLAMSTVDDVYVLGNVTFKNLRNVSTINNVGSHDLLYNNNNNVTFTNNTVYGRIEFLGQTNVSELQTIIVNDINLQKLSRRLLYNAWDQEIIQPFKFKSFKTNNLVVPKINDVEVENLVDVSSTKPQTVVVPKGLRLTKTRNIRYLKGDLLCDPEEVLRNLHNPQVRVWNRVVVKGNVTLWDEHSSLKQIFDNAVLKNQDNTILATVTKHGHTLAENVESLGNINDVNLRHIMEDALLIDSFEEQVVTGKKIFLNVLATDIETLQDINIEKINNRNVSEINEKLVQKNGTDKIISGKKLFFGGLQTERLYADPIHGVQTDVLVSTSTNSRKIPQAIFNTIKVKNHLNLKHVNKIDLKKRFSERLLTDVPAQSSNATYFFNNIQIENLQTLRINDIKIQNVVFDEGNQTIESSKRFMNDLYVEGNVKSDYVNGLKLSDEFQNAILTNETNIINGTVNILAPSRIEGNITTDLINNIPVSYLINIMSKGLVQSEAREIDRITEKMSNFVTENLEKVRVLPTEYLYLEKSNDIQISIPNAVDAKAMELKDHILIHVETEDPGKYCGLPDSCKCPAQHTVQISPEHSINAFVNKGTQRIYSYSDDTVMVHFITNSVSTSSECRTNRTKIMNEVSYLTWNIMPSTNVKGSFRTHLNIFSGYISNVEFFTLEGSTYVVVGRYYDPVWDMHNLDSIVLKFNEDKTKIEEIQRIETQAVKVLSIFYTAQGVILIVGNSNKLGSADTNIYRFDNNQKKFEILRKVQTFECSSATGIVLGEDSFIVLANKRSDLQILKYQHKFDNYYFYQSLHLDNEILGVSKFYSGDAGISDVHLCVVTKNNKYSIFSFHFIEGWKLESNGELDGIKALVSFRLAHESYLFVASSKLSSLLTVVKYDDSN